MFAAYIMGPRDTKIAKEKTPQHPPISLGAKCMCSLQNLTNHMSFLN
jgi:hypothetical protein